MALTPSNMLALGTAAPDFDLPGTDGRHHSLRSFASGKLLLVAFICNHCPFVKHIQPELARLGRDCREWGVAMVAISSNDVDTYPADDMQNMRNEAEKAGYIFPYLLDETQEVAKAYDAACTPDFFLFDGARKLVYRGQFDDSRPSLPKPVTGASLRAAIDAVARGEAPAPDQRASVGCNIKWKRA